jgi:hypothetical protein
MRKFVLLTISACFAIALFGGSAQAGPSSLGDGRILVAQAQEGADGDHKGKKKKKPQLQTKFFSEY